MADAVLDNRYQLRTLLGRGGMGEVWRAHDTRIGREVAVKIVTRGGLTDEALARFDREARIAGNVSGPSIVTVHDYGHDEYAGETVPYLVMELVAGRTLADRVRADGPPAPRTALDWTLQVCEALTIAHAANVVHRDIKPSNVMVTDGGAVKVLDFGIARFMEDQQTRTGLTAAGMVIGSAEYMSPEQAQGHRVDARSDLYSLGCLLFFLLTGRGPFEADSPVGLAYQHVNKLAEPPSRYRVGIPAGVDALALELLAKDPDVRPADARAVGERIRRLLEAGASAASAAGAAAAGGVAAAGGGGTAETGGGGAAAGAPAAGGSAAPGGGKSAAAGAAGAGGVAAAAAAGGIAAAGAPGAGAPGAAAAGPQGPALAGPGGTLVGPSVPGQSGPVGASASGTGSAQHQTSASPSSSPSGRDTDFWMPGQDTKVTEVRRYPGDGPSPMSPIPPVPPRATTAAEQPEQRSRRWFITGATAVAVGGAGVGTWWAVGRGSSTPRTSTGSTQFTGGPGNSTSGPAPTGGSTSTNAGTPSSAASLSSSSSGSSGSSTGSSTPNASNTASSSGSAPSTPHNPAFASSLTGHTGDIAHVAFRSDSQLLATGSFDKTAKLWDVSDPAKPQLLGTCRKHTDQIWNVAISPDGHTLATSSFDQTVVLWDIRNPGAPKATAQVNLGGKLNGVAFSPNGAYLAVGTWGSSIRLIDLSRPTDPAGQYNLTGHSGLVYSVAFSPDGSLLATGSFDKTVRLWDVSDPAAAKPLGSSNAHTDRVFDLAFHPQGQLLAVGSADRSLVLLGVADPTKPTVAVRLAEPDEVTGVAFSPDGRTLATGCGASAQIRLADVTTPASPHVFDPLTGHKGYTYGVAFSPDGRLLASGSEDHTVRLWRF